MRYPLPKKDDKGLYKNGIMKRLGELIEYGPLNQGSKPLKSTLIPYYYKTRDKSSPGFYYFNGVHARTDQPKGDFNGKAMGVEPEYITAGTDAIISDVTGPFTRMLIRDMEQGGQRGWEVMRANDAYSVRAYMAFKYMPSFNLDLPPAHLTNNIVNWCGLLGGSSGWYDRALTEAVLGALAFAKTDETDFGDVEWKCFE